MKEGEPDRAQRNAKEIGLYLLHLFTHRMLRVAAYYFGALGESIHVLHPEPDHARAALRSSAHKLNALNKAEEESFQGRDEDVGKVLNDIPWRKHAQPRL